VKAEQKTAARYAIFLPRVRGTAIGSCWKQYLPLLYIDNFVLQPAWRQIRLRPKDLDGLSPPLSMCPPSDLSLISFTNVF
jgi:hypothetical protein